MIKEISFNKEVACIVGVEKAVIVHYLAFCIEKNKSNNFNFHDGRHWTNNTHESLYKVLPFFKNREQIRRRLDSLIKDGYVIKSDEYIPNNNLGCSYTFSNELEKIYQSKTKSFNKNKSKNKPQDLTKVVQVLVYFNKVRSKLGGRGYNVEKISDSHKNLILARLKEGATVEEMKSIIDLKEKEWLHDFKMRKYLRVETLFNKSKYNMYVGELPNTSKKDTDEISNIKKTLNLKFGMRGIRNEESDLLAKKLIKLGYKDEQYLKSYLL